MIDNDQSTIIEAPEVYSPSPLTLTLQHQRQNVPEKNVDLTPSMDMLWSILLNQTFRISYPHYVL
jgi:hypothetical protein